MCGIAGSINQQLQVERLTRDMFHRGPDEQSTYSDNNLQFHHHRLAIVDIACGKQPMHLGPLTLIFNGEIYNHLEVRKKLKLICKTGSDTETILQAYLSHGASCLQEFDGMFALAIYNNETAELFIARDRAGKKPFYYYHDGKKFVFASEINSLRHQLDVTIDDASIYQYLRYGAFHGSSTPWKQIKELPPASYGIVNATTLKMEICKWWDILPSYLKRSTDDLPTATAKVDAILQDAVTTRLESSDLEVGAFLSGGIDSGLVTAIAASRNSNLRTFTVSFDGTFNEAPLARLVAQKYGTKHTEIPISLTHLKDDFEKIVSNYGEPFFDDSAIPSYYVSKEAKKHLTVILNGDGADEVFGGYRRYVPFKKLDFLDSPLLVRKGASLLKSVIPFSNDKKSKLNFIYRLADLASRKGLDAYLSASTDIFTGYEKHFIGEPPNSVEALQKQMQKITELPLSGLQKIMAMDFTSILPDVLLVKMDIATMAHSLEGRSPFLGKHILEYVPGLSDDLKINGTTTKYLLRNLARKYLPSELIDQPKRGFEVPLKSWINNELRELVFTYLDKKNSYVSQFVEDHFIQDLLYKRVKLSEEKRAKMLYSLLVLEIWKKQSNGR